MITLVHHGQGSVYLAALFPPASSRKNFHDKTGCIPVDLIKLFAGVLTSRTSQIYLLPFFFPCPCLILLLFPRSIETLLDLVSNRVS